MVNCSVGVFSDVSTDLPSPELSDVGARKSKPLSQDLLNRQFLLSKFRVENYCYKINSYRDKTLPCLSLLCARNCGRSAGRCNKKTLDPRLTLTCHVSRVLPLVEVMLRGDVTVLTALVMARPSLIPFLLPKTVNTMTRYNILISNEGKLLVK